MQALKPAHEYHHAAMRWFYLVWTTEYYKFATSHIGLVAVAIMKVMHSWLFFLGPALGCPFPVLTVILPYDKSFKDIRRNTLWLLALRVITFIGVLLPIFFHPQRGVSNRCDLCAPAQGDDLRKWRWRGQPTGVALVRAVPLICLVMFALRAFTPAAHASLGECGHRHGTHRINKDLAAPKLLLGWNITPSAISIIVRYSPNL